MVKNCIGKGGGSGVSKEIDENSEKCVIEKGEKISNTSVIGR